MSKKEHPPPQKARTKAYLKHIMQPHRKSVMLALALALVGVVVFVIQSYLIAWLFSDWLVSLSGKHAPTPELAWQLLPWLGLCLLVRPVATLIKNHIMLKASLHMRQHVRQSLMQALVTLGPARQHFGSDGNLSTKVLEQVDALDGYISRFYIQRYVSVLTPIIIVMATFFYSPLAAVLLLLTAPLVPVFMVLVGGAAAEKSREQFGAMAQLSGRFLDLLRGMPTLKRLGATTQAASTIAEASTNYQKRTMSVLRLAFLSGGVLELFSSLAIALVALYLGLGLLGILPWAKGVTPVHFEGALFILLLAPEFYAPLRALGSDYHAKANAEAGVDAFYPLLAATHQVAHLEKEGAERITRSGSSQKRLEHVLSKVPSKTTTQPLPNELISELITEMAQRPPKLVLDNVSIESSGRVRLAPISLRLSAGERMAISGESGSGKSSLLQALLGFVVFEGELSINDSVCSQNDLSHIRHHMGYLAQSASLLPMSIADNLRLANADATDDELIEVLKKVSLWVLIEQLPQRLDTMLGERGRGLSGGQQQRLAIAQLLLRRSQFWLLDEPCAHLDPETSADIFALLGKLSEGKTVLLVSHELTGVDWVDNAVTLSLPAQKDDNVDSATNKDKMGVVHG